MKNQAISGYRINHPQPGKTEILVKDTAPVPQSKSSTDTTAPHSLPLQQGQARAAGLRRTLEQNTRPAEFKTASKAGVVIKYALDQRTGRRQRADHPEDVIPLDEEIHHLTGEFPSKSRETQQRRKQVLAQRRQVDRGFKSAMPERAEHDVDLMADSWGDDH